MVCVRGSWKVCACVVVVESDLNAIKALRFANFVQNPNLNAKRTLSFC